ncbi:DevA family ABC transporter ATP-binding protein [Gloeothece verrucosa]|uniref:ABC exporter ATP-binding subunit, DevA family n=1 Tax=Gloeothece verrucosa (strain PCC 7822) TaxID=497965 RepID=E0UL90_GLOV7|nr:DevA family ABC transporter ATP-binding protein [Gloeothece verrucosa]ADN17720.1 ABC exporter ATP-binding subunit, DevA family [Gloeothece verrucosa PCC 7822]
MNNPVVEISRLNYYYGHGTLRKQILFNIILDIFQGEIVILSGPSGSGKTTLLTLIGALRKITEGSIKVLNQELLKSSDTELIEVRRKIGYIFQAHNLLRSLTARENVQMTIQLHKDISQEEARIKSEAILRTVGLGKWINYYPDDLSGGQKQRVAIARALVCSPKLVLADEPTASLDSKSGRAVVEILQSLVKEKGSTVLMVTHDNRILDIADRIIYMEDGCLVTGHNFYPSKQ